MDLLLELGKVMQKKIVVVRLKATLGSIWGIIKWTNSKKLLWKKETCVSIQNQSNLLPLEKSVCCPGNQQLIDLGKPSLSAMSQISVTQTAWLKENPDLWLGTWFHPCASLRTTAVFHAGTQGFPGIPSSLQNHNWSTRAKAKSCGVPLQGTELLIPSRHLDTKDWNKLSSDDQRFLGHSDTSNVVLFHPIVTTGVPGVRVSVPGV